MTVAPDFESRRQAMVAAHLKPADERPASTARGVHHMALICRDVETTVCFYQEMLGFPLVDVTENRDYPGSTHFFHDIGQGNLLAFFDFPSLGLGKAVEAHGGSSTSPFRSTRRASTPPAAGSTPPASPTSARTAAWSRRSTSRTPTASRSS
jgi:hypothetical protein